MKTSLIIIPTMLLNPKYRKTSRRIIGKNLRNKQPRELRLMVLNMGQEYQTKTQLDICAFNLYNMAN
jgi:hypothetical protein